MGLTERDKAILDFERDWCRRPGSKEVAVREALGLSATRYYQLLAVLIESPDALAHDPLLVRRLRRQRDLRRRARYEGRSADVPPAR